MIEVEVKNKNEDGEFLKPKEIFNYEYGTIFQQYNNDSPEEWYYISPMWGEESVFTIWKNEDGAFTLSSDTLEDLMELYDHVKVKIIDAKISIKLEVNE